MFDNPLGAPFVLNRFPLVKDDPLQPWDSADSLILEHVRDLDLADKKILIINDSFGALSIALAHYHPVSYADSYLFTGGLRHNTAEKISTLNDLDDIPYGVDLVILKVPPNMSFLEDILCHLTAALNPQAQIICGGMVKHLAKQTFDLLTTYIGTPSTSLAKKKARLIFATFTQPIVPSPYPQTIAIENWEGGICNHANVFSRGKLDIGTRFLLDHLPHSKVKTILDLGCGNGIVGLAAKKINPSAQLIFSDVSFMAIKSARINYARYFDDQALFYWTNCFPQGGPEMLDLVLCNPPFHQNKIMGDFIAWQMFKDARRVLKNGGRLRIVGNGQLGYPAKLKKIFGNSVMIAQNQKFMIVEATKT